MTDINEDLRKQVVAKFGFSESQLRDPNVRAFVDARVDTFKPTVPATTATEDTPSTTLGDWLLEGQKAVSNAIQMVPNMVSGVGSMLDPEFAQTPFGHAMQFTSDLYGNYTNKLASEQSPAFQAANSAKIYDDATGEWHMPTATQAASTVLNAAAMLPAIIAGGGAATAGLSVAKLPSLIGGIAKLSGAGTKAAAKLGLAGDQLAAARLAAAARVGKVGTGAAGMGVIGGAAGSGDAYNEAYGAVLQTMRDNNVVVSPEDAHRVASTLAREAAIKQLPISILTNAVGLGGAKAATGGIWKRIAKGALIDAVPEVVEEGGQGVVVNATVREIDPSRDLMAGVRTRAALGLIAGGVMGGGMAGFEGVVDNHEQRQLALIAEGKQRREAMLAELNRPAADIINTPAQPLIAPPIMTPAVQPPAIAAPEAPPADVGVQRTPEVQKAWKDAENVIGMAQDANDHLDEAIPGWAEMPHEQKRDRINAALAATDEEAAVDPAIGKLRTWAERQAAAMTSLASATAADHGIQVTHADLDAIGAAAEAAPAVHAAEPAAAPKAPETVLQNRDRSSSASIEQMQSISQKPDYLRLASSNSLAEGAPVVFGDIPATAVVGKSQQVATSKGDRIPVQYAAVEADDLVASHNSDGTPVAEYANGVPGKLRAIAGNGRVAGLKLAYSKNRAGDYAAEMAADDSHGISADAIKGMRNPVLVRVMPADKVTPDIGDVSNTSGTATLSPAEMATNDIRRIDLQAIAFDEDGEVTEQSVMQFIQSMPIGERAGLMDGKRPARAAYDRLNAAIFAQAYGDPELIRLYAQAADGEAKNVMRGLAIAAPHMARLEGAGDLDIRPIVAEAATIAVNAGRKKQTLAKYLETNDPLIRRDSRVVAAMFVEHGRSAKTVGERLSDAAKFAHTEATKSTEPDMFGDVQPKATREDVTRGITDGTFEARPQSVGEPAGSVADGGHAVGQEGRLDETRGDAGKTAAGIEGEVKPLLSAQEAPKEAPKAPRASNVDMFAKTPEEDAKQRLADEIARLKKKQDANAETAAKLPDGPLFDGTAQQQNLGPTDAQKEAGRGGARTPVSDSAKSEAVRLYMTGMTQEQVALALGISDTVVFHALKNANVPARVYGSKHNKSPEETKSEAIRLYSDDKMTLPEVSRRLGVGITTVARWMRKSGVQRSQSEAYAVAAGKGRKGARGLTIPWQSEKTGQWEFADSKWEAVRMSQLDADDSVKSWSKLTDRVPYTDSEGVDRMYHPDFIVEYADGRSEVEEIKPSFRLNDPDNKAKSAAAIKYFGEKGISYRYVTENEIGTDDIEQFNPEGFAKITEEERNIRRNSRRARAAREKRALSKNATGLPTQAQIDAGNYKKEHVRMHGLDIAIENPRASVRSGKDENGKEWSNTMAHDYGYIKRTIGADEDHVDVFIGPNLTSEKVFVVNQTNKSGKFDEHKVMLGFSNEKAALEGYLANYDMGWDRYSDVVPMSIGEFKSWLKVEDQKKPAVAPEPATDLLGKPVAQQGAREPVAEPAKADTYQTVLAEREERAKRFGREKIIEETKSNLAGMVLGRNFGESVDDFFASNPYLSEKRRAYTDWLSGTKPATPADPVAAAVQAQSASAPTIADEEKAIAILDAADVRGKERLDAISKLRSGEYTLDDLKGAYPAKAVQATASSEKPEKNPDGKIDDLGEKIGGARKDTAVATGPTGKPKSTDERPAWARRFEISQIVSGSHLAKEEGKWVIRDSKNKDRMGQPRQVGGLHDTRADAELMVPVIAVALKHRALPGRDAGDKTTYEIWRDTGDRKRVKVVDRKFDSRDDALRYMAEHAVEIIETNTTFGEADLPKPDNVKRIGVLRRSALFNAVIDAADADAKRLANRVITQAGLSKPNGFSNIPLESMDDARLSGDVRAALNESPSYMAAVNTKLLSNLYNADAFSVEGYGSLDIPSRRIVNAAVISLGDDQKVLGSVVELIPVDVVNLFAGKDFSPRSLLGDEAMLGDLLATNVNPSVRPPDAAALALVRAVARMAAKGRLSNAVKSSLESDSALRANGANFSHNLLRPGDVSGRDFMAVFGFRSIEFGNWNNQEERQDVMNAAYDGLLDLAEVMGIPPKAISLNGDLALAFGARGHGLTGARAHYEPGKAVINLTKMNGAGALAHEWFHALDHYLARQDGKASSEWVTSKDGTRSLKVSDDSSGNMASGGFRRQGSGVREEVRKAYIAVMETMSNRAEKYVEDSAKAERFVADVRENVSSKLDSIRKNLAAQLNPEYYKRNNKPASAEQLAEFDTIAEQILRGESLTVDYRAIEGSKSRSFGGGRRLTNDALEKIGAIYKAVRGRSGFSSESHGPIDELRKYMQLYDTRLKMLSDAQQGSEKEKKIPTEFRMDAKSLDQGRGTDYWTTPHELAARAFQGYVEDKIAELGGKSPFLNYGPERAGILTPWGVKRPFPAGAERKAINADFDKLVSAFETKETDNGVAMFKMGGGDKIGLTVPEVQKIVDGMKAGAGNLKVVADFDDLPQDIRDEAMKMRAEKGDIKAAHHRGTSYLVASNLSRNEVSRAVFHEVFVHGGLRNRYGMSIEAKMISLASKLEGTGKPSERVMALAKKQDINLSAYVRSLNNDTTKSNRQKLAILTEELLAHMGETTGSLRAYLEEIVGAIRQFLRNIGLADLADLGVTDLRNELRLARKAAIEAEGNAGTPSFSSRAAGPETGGIAQPGGRGVDYKHEIRPLDQLLRDANTSLDLNGRGRIGLVAGEWAEPSRYRAELGRKNAFIAEEDRVATAEEGRVEQERLIAAAKENGFFIGPSHPLLKALTLHENKRGMEHDAYIVGEEKGRVVIRSTLPGSFGHANKHSPAYYLKRIAEYNQVFPNIQVRLIGVGQNEDGSAVILTAQAFVAGKEYDTEAELDAAMRKQGWFAIGVPAKGLPARYQHKETKAIISDVHVGNILHIGDELFPIDVIVEKMPKSSGGKINEPPKFKLVSDSSPEAGKQFVIAEESLRDAFIRRVQDKFNRVKTVQRTIEESTGQQLPDYLNVYQQEELTHGKSETALREFEEKHVDPLIAAMSKAKVTREELDEYLYAAHAKERNDYIAEINPSMPDNGSGMTYKDAAAILKAWQADPRYIDMVDLAKRVYAINEERLNTIERAGLESPETIAQWRRYEAYVPLKGTAEKSGWTNKVGQGFSIKGKESKQALGRKTRAESPLLHSIGQTEQTLLRAEKNPVAQSFLKLVDEFPNADLWEVIDSPKADLVRRFDKKSREVEWAPNTNLRNDPDVFVVKVGGVEKYIRVHDERLLAAMKNLGPEPLDMLSRTLGRVNRFLAMINTSLNPEFVISNFARDIQTAIANLETEYGRDDPRLPKSVTKQVIKDVPAAVRGIYHALRKTEGKQDSEWVKLFNEFREDGGQIGFFGLNDYETKAAELQKRLNEANGDWKALGKKGVNDFLEFIMDANSSIENATRLAAYKAARDVGVSRQKAASLAKNLTVNFNRKGELGTLLNSLYLFANASIQGTAQLGRVMTSKKGRYLAAGISIAAVLLAELNRMLAGDDDDDRNFYDKVPDYVKERNLIVMKWWDDKGGYMTLPLPYGYNIFNVAGNLVSDVAHGKPVSTAAVSMAGVLVGAFSPLGSSSSQSAAGWMAKLASPTILDPALELAMNENFAGHKIYNEGFPYATPLPESALFWRSTSEVAKWVAESMNVATGGSDFRSGGIDVSPDSIEYLFGFATGGAGGFATRILDVAAKLAEGEDIPKNKIPFARKVSAEVNPKDDIALYYDRRDSLKQIEDERGAARREGGKAFVDFQQKFKQQVSLLPMVKATDKQLKQLRDQRKRIDSAKVPDSMKRPKLQQIDDRIKVTVDRFNKRYGEVVGN